MKINRTIGIISYIITILSVLYMMACTGFVIRWHSIGGNILYYHPDFPLTEEFTGEATVIPAILLFIYVILSGIYFIRMGYKKIKNTA